MDLVGIAIWVGAAVALFAIGVALLRALGPADWSLFRQRPDRGWPPGVQEDEPHPWDFGGLDRPVAGPGPGEAPPARGDGTTPPE